ncbi:MAG: fibronectin type III domain-containing protein, partial [Ruminiclostridium sp.]
MKKGLMRVGAFATALVMTASALSVSVYAAPAYYNSRDYGYVTSVKDQGNWGTCWAFAGTSVSETSLIKKYPERFTAGTLDLSENIYTYMIAHPALFGPLNLSGDTATYTGSSSTHYLEIGGNAWCAAFAIMNGVGPYYESAAYPYDAFGTPGIADKNFTEAEYNELRDSGMAKMTGFYLARMGDGSGNEELKQLILDYGSAVITYCETYTDGQFGTNGGYYYYCPTAYTINHAVTVVGWDDNIPASAFKTAPEGNGAWLVKNSWGESQRDGGYFWISYYDKTIGDKCVTYDYTIEGEDDYYDKRYSYDSGNNFTYFYNNSFEELYWGDIFTAEEDSYINGASFYINKGVTVEASVYTDLKDANDPSSGTKAATATIVPQYEGYNAVTFDNPPKVTNGSKFSIVLKLNDSVKSPRIYTENAISMTDVTYSLQSKAGESFYAIDPADGWHDMYSEGFKNLLLKAYATVNKRACQHTYGNWITDKAPTCTAEGTKHRVCSKCGESETGTIAATGHKYVDTVVKPSYTAKGYTLHKCSVCGDSYKDNYTDMLVISGVSSLTAKEVTYSSVTLGWNTVSTVSGYIIEQNSGGKWSQITKIPNNKASSYTVNNLSEGTTYPFRIKAYVTDSGKEYYSSYTNLNVNTLMKTPANIKGSATSDSVTIQWDKNANATGYIVEQYKSGAWTKLGVISSNATVKYTVKGLAEGTTYSFRVKSYKNADSKTDYSTYANINVRTLMKTPANIKGSATADSVTIQWDKNANATGYIVEQYKSGSWTKLGVISNNATVKYTVKGLAEGTTYSFRVKSYKNADGKTDYSAYANINVRTLMKTPANIKGSSTADSVTIQWDKNANATGYIVEQYKSGAWTKLGVISNNATVKYTVKGLAEGTTYSFRVKSYKNADSKTDYSTYANINVRTLMKTPANIKGSSTADSVTIQWDKNANATGYIVEQYKSGAWTKLGVISNNATVKYTVKGLAEGTTYSFRVKSYKNADGKTDYSAYANINVRTLMKTPANIKGSATADSVTIQWDKNANATGYIVEQYKSGAWTKLGVISSNATVKYTVKGLAEGTTYSFRVKSYKNADSKTDYSTYANINVRTLMKTPANIKGSATADSVTFQWDKN